MAGVSVAIPNFSGGMDEDITTFVRRFHGFLDSININVRDNAQRVQATGLFQSALSGPAGDWYDEEILGKNWMLTDIYDNTTVNTTANLQARTMAQMNTSNSFRLHSLAHAFAHRPGNNAITVGAVEARMVPPKAFAEDWTNSGGVLTDDAPRFAGNSGAVPIILVGIQLGQAIYYFENFYPSVLEERCKVLLIKVMIRLKTFYEKVKKYGKLLNFGDEVVNHQFFRGLSPDNQLEVERIGAEKTVSELVKNLEKVEKRKSEMRLGLSKRTGGTDHQAQIQPTSAGSHKPSHSGFSPEDVDRMIKSATEKITQNFQLQIQELQAKIPKVPYQKNIETEIPTKTITVLDHFKKPVQTNLTVEEWNKMFNSDPTEFHEEQLRKSQYIKPISDTNRIANRIAERLEQRRLDKEIADLSSGIYSLNINDPVPDPMDTTNLILMENKPPTKTKDGKKESKSKGISIDTTNLRKIIHELIIEELTHLGLTKKTTSKEIQKFSEAYSDGSMDIDLLRLDNKKDLASVEGVVEGKLKLPILIDSCCNKSVMPEEIYKELGLILDTNKICKLSGASTNIKSLGTVKNVKITLAPGCTITDDFAVIANYPYHELILNRPRLREYNYDLLESRKHMAITCNGKDFFIPIIPARDEHKKMNSPVLEALNH
ncbi:14636_t:CDS:2 [Entrophospora sp. SA101]|nr:14636_t:CDS:2 [Entrophospora sp. SA101]